jgi:starch-binding outer membrane protein, SusD/RagB family
MKKMNNKKSIKLLYLFILFFILINNSCEESLDIDPLNILTSERVFQSPDAIESYMASLYNAIPLDGFNQRMINSTDLAMSYLGNAKVEGTSDGTWFSYWGYSSIRNVNDFLVKLPDANLSESQKKILRGESLFLRAFYYFGMVKRYGGVPIVKEVQQFTGDNLSDLQIPRNTEKESWDFIATDLDEAISLLPVTNVNGRVTRYAALALKSRAMLYAASRAKYGSVMLDGLVGIPSGESESYWQKAYDAAKVIIESGHYSLYNKNSDKAINFAELFIEEENSEVIFRKYYIYPNKTHHYNWAILPYAIRAPGGDGSQVGPTLEIVEEFEYKNGSPGELKIENSDGSPIFYENATDLFKDKDPRCVGSIIVPYSTFRGKEIGIRSGIYDGDEKIEGGLLNALYNPDTKEIDENGTVPVHGNCGLVTTLLESTQTGFYLRKYLDYNLEQSRAGSSDNDYIIFRYGEILLNYAEAAVELNKISDAKWAVNEIRNRAGIKLLDDAEVTIEKVRHERLVELAFEWHRWWDLRRWRIAHEVLNNSVFTQLRPYWDIQEQAYRFEKKAMTERVPKTFDSKVYYGKIGDEIIERNPKFVQNPGY